MIYYGKLTKGVPAVFGFVVANTASMSEDDLITYRSFYCGLCHCIGNDYGLLKRTSLNYDMTFLTILLSSLYEVQKSENRGHCLVHPFREHTHIITDATKYTAAMNIALACNNYIDNWNDDKNVVSYLLAKLFHSSISQISHDYPSQYLAIEQCMKELSKIEHENSQNPDAGANVFGQLLGTLFVWKNDRWSDLLYEMGYNLGQYIYLADAILDLPKDIRRKSYNPLSSRWSEQFEPKDYFPILKIFLGACTDAFERLPIVENTAILRNVLYSGVWTCFYQKDRKHSKEEHYV